MKIMKRGSSPNSLPIPILKNCAVLSFPISYLVNPSFITGESPKLCKITKVIPLFKKGDPLDCSNHRPIDQFFRIDANQMWSTSRIYIRATFVFTLHQWLEFCI